MAKNTSSSKGNTDMSYHILRDGQTKKAVQNALQAYTAPKKRLKLRRANKASAKVLSLLYMAKTARYNAKIATVTTQKTLKDRSPYE